MQFAKQEIHYLGHVLSAKGVHTDPAKVTTVLQWPTPTNVRKLRGILGLAGFYRKFVCYFAIIAKPFTNLLKKHSLFVWTYEHQQALHTLQKALCSASVLGILDFSKPFAIETDASQTVVGADVLLQSGHPLAHVSKPLGVKTQGLSLEEGLLKYNNRIWVGRNTSMQLKLIQILHSSPIGGHSGVSATIKYIQNCLARVKEASY